MEKRALAMDEQPNRNLPIEKLTTKGHLSVSERASLPGGRAPASAIITAIEEALLADRWFPADWRPEQDFDGGLIELRDDGSCRIIWKVEVGVLRFDQVDEEEFATAQQAADAYARRFYKDNIDGVPIDWSA